MKHTTFTIGNKNTSANNLNNTFCGKPNYSKILDDIIIANIKKNNPYLCNTCPFKTTIATDSSSFMKGDDEFTKAAKFLANYKKSAKAPMDIPFKLNTIYKLANGSSIIFYDDEFQIDCDIFKYDDFDSLDFIKSLAPAKKNIIISIFGATNIKININ